MVNNSSKYREAYNKGEEIVPDFIYDEMFDQSEAELNDVGQGELVEHLHFMGSLPTHFTNINELSWETLSKMGCSKSLMYTVSYKIDGVPGSCWYNSKTGFVERVLSRGKRLEGFVMADAFKAVLPKIRVSNIVCDEYIDLRGEFVIYEPDFKEINKQLKASGQKEFANPRSMVSASVNAKEPNPLIMSKMHFLAHGIWIGNEVYNHFQLLDEIMPNGQFVAPHTYTSFDELVKTVKDIYSLAFNKSCIIPVDGIVIQHSVTAENDGHCNKDRIAVKQLDENAFSAESTVNKITYKVNTNGEYVPLIWFDTVVIDGTNVQKCSGFCYDFLIKKNISVGAKVKVLKRGGVIPYIHEVLEPGTGDLMLPADCKTPQDGDIHLYVNDREGNSVFAKFVKGGISLEIDTFGDTFWKDLYAFFYSEGYSQPSIFDVIESCRNGFINKIVPSVLPDTPNTWERLNTFTTTLKTLSFEKVTLATCSNGIGAKTAKLIGDWFTYGTKLKETKYVKEFLNNTELVEKIRKYGTGNISGTAEPTTSSRKKVIMSKKPTNGMKKADFYNTYLASEYDLTEDIKEADLLICPEGETSSKIKTAEKKGITIKHYSDYD